MPRHEKSSGKDHKLADPNVISQIQEHIQYLRQALKYQQQVDPNVISQIQLHIQHLQQAQQYQEQLKVEYQWQVESWQQVVHQLQVEYQRQEYQRQEYQRRPVQHQQQVESQIGDGTQEQDTTNTYEQLLSYGTTSPTAARYWIPTESQEVQTNSLVTPQGASHENPIQEDPIFTKVENPETQYYPDGRRTVDPLHQSVTEQQYQYPTQAMIPYSPQAVTTQQPTTQRPFFSRNRKNGKHVAFNVHADGQWRTVELSKFLPL
jgi:hypothetical protein